MTEISFGESEIRQIIEIINVGMDSASIAVSNIINGKVEVSSGESQHSSVQEIDHTRYINGGMFSTSYKNDLTGRVALLIQEDDLKDILRRMLEDSQDIEKPLYELGEMEQQALLEIVRMGCDAFAKAISEVIDADIQVDGVKFSVVSNISSISDAVGCTTTSEVVTINYTCTVQNFKTFEIKLIGLSDMANSLYDKSERMVHKISKKKKKKDNDGFTEFNINELVYDSENALKVSKIEYPEFFEGGIIKASGRKENQTELPPIVSNTGMLLDIGMKVSVEIGKTKMTMKQVMNFNEGTIIQLSKQAGAPVDVVANGNVIAKGDIVVIDDNFGVRITEIVGNSII